MNRQKKLEVKDLSPTQRRVYEDIVSGPRGEVRGPLSVWLARPELADRAQKLGRYARYETLLPPRISELAILLTARIWSAEFEWWAHRPAAEKAGLPDDIIESILKGRKPPYETVGEKIVHNFVVSIYTNKNVDSQTFQQAVDHFGYETVVDLVGVLGYYSLISMTINTFMIEPYPGYKPELAPHDIDPSFFRLENCDDTL